MAKDKETTTTPAPVDPRIQELEQQIKTLTLEKEQAEGELKRVLADPFKSREGLDALLVKAHRALFHGQRILRGGAAGTAGELREGYKALSAWFGPERAEDLEKQWRGQ